MHERFRRLARRSSEIVRSAEVFLAACVAIIGWAVLGPRYGFSDTWQLVHQHGNDDCHISHGFHHPERAEPRRQGDAAQARRAVKGARTGMVRLEEMTDQELCSLAGDFENSALDSPWLTRSRASAA
jgi:hypothetical protein